MTACIRGYERTDGFQPALPLRGVTFFIGPRRGPGRISTRTPLAGSDMPFQPSTNVYIDFNPHSPCGELPVVVGAGPALFVFQPALPMRGVTEETMVHKICKIFQPALPLRGVTPGIRVRHGGGKFQPALPLRVVTEPSAFSSTWCRFQPALPLRGVTS